MSRLLAVLPLCITLLVAAGCSRRPDGPPNILLITLDTTRADHIGAYGYRNARTPRLDALARRGVLFEHALSSAPITLPAHASLMTGRYPFSHGVRNNGAFSLSASMPTLATTLHDAGYRTAAFVSAFVLDRRFGLARGFDVYDDRGRLERPGDQTAAAAAAWLDTNAADRAPFFIWVHLYDAHDPYDPPPPFREAFAQHPYDGEIAFDDQVIGSLLDRLTQSGRLSSTLVAVVGDHGESLGEHGEDTHAVFVYESTLRVPMILAGSTRIPEGRRVQALVRAVDVAPTLLDVAGQPPLSGAQGQTLMPLVGGTRRTAAPSSAYAESYFPQMYLNWAPLRSIQDERWKFIDAPAPELYDLQRDPAEQTNLAATESSRAAALARALKDLAGGASEPSTAAAIDRETAAKLAALGYIGASSPGVSPDAVSMRSDPKQMIAVFNRVRRANAAVEQGRFAEGASIARDALAGDARNAFARLVLANAAMGQGRYREAIAAYRSYLELVPESADAHHQAAIAYGRLGDVERALVEEDVAIGIDPRDGDAHGHRGGLLASRGDLAKGSTELRTAVEILPENVGYRVALARVLVAAGQLDEAESELRRAMQLQPDSPDAHAGYGNLLVARGEGERAVQSFSRALAIRPDADDVRLDLARTLEQLGRTAQARNEYARLAAGNETPGDIKKAAKARLR